MRKLTVFNMISLDGYFVDANNDMSWAHQSYADEEWRTFISENAQGGGVLLFGRITYDLMASYWPMLHAIQNDPIVAEQMNGLPKVVFSRTMNKASWSNSTLFKGDLIAEVRKMKSESGDGLVIMGSGSIVSQLTAEKLIDEYQIIVVPIVLGTGRTLFEGIKEKQPLKLIKSRIFKNGNVLLCYEPV